MLINAKSKMKLIVSNIVDSMSDSDIMSFLTYQNAGGMNTDFTSVKKCVEMGSDLLQQNC